MTGPNAHERGHDETRSPTVVTVVESEACHFCVDAHLVLDDFAVDYPLVVESVDVRSELGHVLMARHRAAMSPLVLIDGLFFSSGRVPRRKLAKMLAQRYGAVGPVSAGASHG